MLEAALLDEPAPDPAAGSIFRPGHDEDLDRLTLLAEEGQAMVEALERREREETGITSLRVRNNKVFGYFIEVTKANLSAVPDRYIRKQTMVNAERYFTDELKTLEEDVLNAEERRVEITRTRWAELVAEVQAAAGELRTLASALAELDVLGSFAAVAGSRDWCRPELHDGDTIEILDGRHPVVEAAAGELGERFVPNDVHLSEGQRLVVITGPNMAGKSTIMRQTALIVILAHLGGFVPARGARIGRVDRIFTRVGASDDLSRGRSTFMVEMTETARILRSAGPHDLIVLDEIGRGTSTFDGLSIAWSVAEWLHNRVGARTLFATHYHELTNSLNSCLRPSPPRRRSGTRRGHRVPAQAPAGGHQSELRRAGRSPGWAPRRRAQAGGRASRPARDPSRRFGAGRTGGDRDQLGLFVPRSQAPEATPGPDHDRPEVRL